MELGNIAVCCPVCTLYMREGITLQSHLDTHPKDRVIEALVRLSNLAGAHVHESPSEYFRNVHLLPSSASRAATSQCISSTGGTFLSPESGSMSAVINYQLLSSRRASGTSILPQYVPLSTLLSGSECSHHPPPVVFNPFLLQQQQVQIITAAKRSSNGSKPVGLPAKQFPQVTTSVSSSGPFSSHLPSALTSSVSQARLSASVNSVHRTSSPPIKTQCPGVFTSVTQVNPCSFSQSTLLTTTRRIQKQHKPLQYNTGTSASSLHAMNNVLYRNSKSRSNMEISEKVQTSGVCSKNKKSRTSTEVNEKMQIFGPVRNSRSRNNSTESNERMEISEKVYSAQVLTASTVDHVKLNDAVAKEIEMEVTVHDELSKEIVNQAGTEENEERAGDSLCDVTNENCSESSELVQSNCDMGNVSQPSSPESLLRIRNDLSRFVRGSSVTSPNSSNNCELVEELHSKMKDQSQEQKCSKVPELVSVASSSGCIIQVFSSEDEYITSDSVYDSKENFLLSSRPSSEDKDNFKMSKESMNMISKSRLLSSCTSENMNLATFGGVHVVGPCELVGSPEHCGENLDGSQDSHVMAELRAVSPQGLLAEPDVTTMNIQTDEMMPPKGELSEQESVGGNDSSLWAPVTRADDDVCASYDLLARESWEASDGSDGEGNGLFSPSISEKLNLDRSKSEKLILERCSSVVKSSKSSSSRANRKPKVEIAKTYLCITCDKIFDCPKERRVHQRITHHGEGSVRMRKRTSVKKQECKTKSKPVKYKKKDVVEVKNPSGGPQFTRFEEVILKTEAVVDRDEAMVSEDSKVSVCTSEVQQVKSEGKIFDETENMISREVHSCLRCKETFSSVRLLRSHMRISHISERTIKLTCKICKKRFLSETLMQVHFKIHPLECTRCGKYFYRRQNFKLHIRRHLSIRPYKCGICDKSFITRQKLEEHTNTHTGNSPLKCSLCDDRFRRYSNLIEHKNRHHLKLKKKVKDFVCHCGEIFHSKKKLEWHKETHDTKPKSCLCCSEKYVHETSLTRHIRKAHDNTYVSKRSSKSQLVPCTVCGGVFFKSSLATHMRIHSGTKPFSCPVCSKTFTTKWNLNLHRWTHASRSSKPFRCSLCKSAFIRQNDYKSHMHSHRNIRPYTCNYCGCQFIRKYNCQRHVREHERTKSFSCNICGKLFHRSYYLTEHLRIHSGSRPFVCNICGKASSTKSNHNKHVKIHHAREPLNTEG